LATAAALTTDYFSIATVDDIDRHVPLLHLLLLPLLPSTP
jgi:hypothetical protein